MQQLEDSPSRVETSDGAHHELVVPVRAEIETEPTQVASDARAKLSEALQHGSDISSSLFGNYDKISLDGHGTELLADYFERNPSEFGDKVMAALREEDGRELARVLKESGLHLATGYNHGELKVLGVGVVEGYVETDRRAVTDVFGHDLATTGADRKIPVLSGINPALGGDLFIGRGGVDLATGNHTAFVSLEGINGGYREEYRADALRAIAQNEVMHIEQFKRWGENFVLGHVEGMEVISDAGSLKVSPYLETTRIVANAIMLSEDTVPSYARSSEIAAEVIQDVAGVSLQEFRAIYKEDPEKGMELLLEVAGNEAVQKELTKRITREAEGLASRYDRQNSRN